MLRRYSPLKESRGTVIPAELRIEVYQRDGGCLGPRVGMPGPCVGALELDHIAASHAMGMKSSTTAANLASLCSAHHREKTANGRKWRPLLLEELEAPGD